MSEFSKLNIKTVKLPPYITKLFTLSSGYTIGIYSKYENKTIEDYIYLYKIKNRDFIELQKFVYFGYNPIIGLELQNNTLLTAGRNSVQFFKIKNDKLYRTAYLSRDHNGDSLAEIIQAIQTENGKIILQNILADIYVLEKNENYIDKESYNVTDGYITEDSQNDLNIEYKFVYKFLDTKRRKINPIGYSYGNIVVFNNFKVDVSDDKYEKININSINITKNIFCLNYKFNFKDFILLKLDGEKDGSIYAIIDKKYYEIVRIIKVESDINEMIHIGENKYLFTFSEIKNKIFLADLTNYDFKIIDSKLFDYKFTREYDEDKLFIIKYEDSIFVLDNTL